MKTILDQLFPSYLIGLAIGYIFILLFIPSSNRISYFKSRKFIPSLFIIALPSNLMLSFILAIIMAQSSFFFSGTFNSKYALMCAAICIVSCLMIWGIIKINSANLKSIDSFKGRFKYVKFHTQVFNFFIFHWLNVNSILICAFIFIHPATIISNFIGLFTSFLSTAIYYRYS